MGTLIRHSKRPRCLIDQDNKFRTYWDIWITFLLVIVCTLLPLTIAFNLKQHVWHAIYLGSDVFFLLDMVS